MMAYYMEQIADRRYMPHVVWEDVPAGYRETRWGTGSRVPAERVPVRAKQKSSHRQLPYYFGVETSPAISETFKDLVEALEPGVHQFFAFEVARKTGEPLDRPYYQMNILPRIDAIIPERSNVYWKLAASLGTYRLGRGAGPVRLTLRKDLIAGHHLWLADRHYSSFNMFFSDELMQAVEAAKLKGLRARYLAEE